MSIRLGDPWDNAMCASYDNWKTRSPDDEYGDEPEDECLHEETEIDWNGLATCNDCGKCWEASAQELELERERTKRHEAWCRREERRIRLEKWFGWMRFWLWFKRKPKPADIDDNIPF